MCTTNLKAIFNRIFSKKVRQEIKETVTVAPEPTNEKQLGKGRAFKNRKTTRGRRAQYIPIGKDSMGKTHHKLICHSY